MARRPRSIVGRLLAPNPGVNALRAIFSSPVIERLLIAHGHKGFYGHCQKMIGAAPTAAGWT
jgi:hypothetical protein